MGEGAGWEIQHLTRGQSGAEGGEDSWFQSVGCDTGLPFANAHMCLAYANDDNGYVLTRHQVLLL